MSQYVSWCSGVHYKYISTGYCVAGNVFLTPLVMLAASIQSNGLQVGILGSRLASRIASKLPGLPRTVLSRADRYSCLRQPLDVKYRMAYKYFEAHFVASFLWTQSLKTSRNF